MDFLILAEADGVVDMTHEAIASRTNRPLDIIRKTISELEGPDGRSRTPDKEGRRIIRLDSHRDWGWQIVNYQKFRDIASDEQRKAMTRERVRKHREKPEKEPCNAPVTHGNASNAMQKQRQRQKHSTPKPPKGGYHADTRTVLWALNEAAGVRYREVDSNLALISQRLSEPDVTLEGVKKMIHRQVERWKSTEMETYLRPETLFRKSKFDGYYAARDLPLPPKISSNGKPPVNPNII